MTKRTSICLCMLMGSSLLCGAQSRRVADQPPELRDALVRDASCDLNGVPGNPSERNQLLLSQVSTQAFRGPKGASGVIAKPTSGCYCEQQNCSTYVYVSSAHGYRLVLREKLASLRPMRVFKKGFPSLSGKMQTNETVAETTVFDWDGTQYEPNLCATVTQTSNPKRPTISKHACHKPGRQDQP